MKRTILFITSLLLIVGCSKLEVPSLSETDKIFKYNPNQFIDWNKDRDLRDPPLVLFNNGYKMIKLEKNPEIKDQDGYVQRPESYTVVWGWMFDIQNTSSTRMSVTVTYNLLDKDGFEITNDIKSIFLEFGERDIIRSTSIFDYTDLDRVYSSNFELKYDPY